MSFSGTISKQLSAHRSVSGDVGFTGQTSTVEAVEQAVSGALSFAGALTKKLVAHRSVDGVLEFAGALTKKIGYHKTVDGTVSFDGEIGTGFFRQVVSGILGFSGEVVARLLNSHLDVNGALEYFMGKLTMSKNGIPIGTVSGIILGRFNAFKGWIKDIGGWIRL